MNNKSIYNSSFELGLRILILLSKHQNREFDINQIIYFDYLAIHSNDIESIFSPISLHPDTPFRSGELLVKYKQALEGIDLMYSRGLLNIHFSEDGIKYSASNLTLPFVKLFNNDYYEKINGNFDFIFEYFDSYSTKDIEQYMNERIFIWGSEFEYESFLRGK